MRTIRSICAGDSRLMLAWRNHPGVRRWCFDDRIIEPAAHETWFRELLANPDRIGLMLIDEGLPVACIRFDCGCSHARGEHVGAIHESPLQGPPGLATISIMTSPDHRGKGYGRDLLHRALRHEMVTRRVVTARAETFETNPASMRLFEGAGFRQIGHGTRHGHAYVEWSLKLAHTKRDEE